MIKDHGVREIISLDGSWQIIFDPDNRGRREQWFRREVFTAQKGIRTIHVPSCWEESEQDYEGVAWYHRTFKIPHSLNGKTIRLRFGAVNYRAEVWLNNEVVGWHEGGYTPFEFDISDLLELEKENDLIVRVIGPLLTRPQFIDGLQQDEMPHWRGAIAGGIWQSVKLIATSPIYIKDVFVEPRLRDEVILVHAKVENTMLRNRRLSILIKISEEDEPSRTVAKAVEKLTVSPGENTFTAKLKIPNPKLWSPKHPNLYVAQVDLEADGKVIDSLKTRFGMREFTIRNGKFYLNGERIYLKGIFYEGVYPNTLAYPPSEEFLRREIKLIKAAGFNVIRLWRKPAPPPLLDLTDEMGIMVIAAPPIECMNQNPAVTPQLETRLKAEVRELILRDRNHPSVIYWEIFNEIVRPALLRLRHNVCLEARKHDPTRVIVDESGGSRSKWGAHAYLPYSNEPMRILERHRNIGSPFDAEAYNEFITYGEPGTLAFMSECGGGAFPDLPRVVARYRKEGNPKTPDYRSHEFFLKRLETRMKEYGLDKAFSSTSALCLASQNIQAEENKRALEALRINPNIAGYCVHAWTGADWIIGSGLIDIWMEEPWKAYYTAKEVNQPIYLAIHVTPRNAYARQKIKVTVTAVNELKSTTGRLILTMTSPDGREIFRKQKKLMLREGIHTVMDVDLIAGDVTGHYTLTATLECNDRMLSENTFQMLVLNDEDLTPPTEPFTVLDPDNELKPFAKKRGLVYSDFTPNQDPSGPVFVCPSDARSPEILEMFIHVLDYARHGGTVILLRPPCDRFAVDWDEHWIMKHRVIKTSNRLLRKGLMPFTPVARRAQGNWIGLFHAVKEHPIFDGLPTNCLMGQDYHNVCAKKTLINIEGESVVLTISLDYTRYYFGLSDVWVGSDLTIVPHGKGRIILSMLRLLENLGTDPVADRIFYNMVRFSARISSDCRFASLDEAAKNSVSKV